MHTKRWNRIEPRLRTSAELGPASVARASGRRRRLDTARLCTRVRSGGGGVQCVTRHGHARPWSPGRAVSAKTRVHARVYVRTLRLRRVATEDCALSVTVKNKNALARRPWRQMQATVHSWRPVHAFRLSVRISIWLSRLSLAPCYMLPRFSHAVAAHVAPDPWAERMAALQVTSSRGIRTPAHARASRRP